MKRFNEIVSVQVIGTQFAIDLTNQICYSNNKYYNFTEEQLKISIFICNVVLAAK